MLQVNHCMKWKCRLIALFLDRKCDKNCHFTCNLIAKSSAVRFLEFIKACLKKYNSVLIINTLQWDSRTIFGLGRAYWPKRTHIGGNPRVCDYNDGITNGLLDIEKLEVHRLYRGIQGIPGYLIIHWYSHPSINIF